MKPSKDKGEVIWAEVRVNVRALSWETERDIHERREGQCGCLQEGGKMAGG